MSDLHTNDTDASRPARPMARQAPPSPIKPAANQPPANGTADLGPAPSPPPDPLPKRYPENAKGFREGRFQVVEWMATVVDKVEGTLAYWTITSKRHAAQVAKELADLVGDLAAMPARMMLLFPWGGHLLTDSARTTISMWGVLFTGLGMLKGIFWALTLLYAFEHPLEAMGIAALIVSIDMLVERSVAMTDRTEGDLIKKPAVGLRGKFNAAMTIRNALVVCRIVAIVLLSIGNAEAIRLRLARAEIDHEIASAEAEVNVGLRARRLAEIEAEITRRGTEINAEHAASLQTFTSQRASARTSLAADREQSAVVKRETVARRERAIQTEMGGGFTGRPGVGRSGVGTLSDQLVAAQTDLNQHEAETVRILARFDRETNQGITTREQTLASRRAALNAEKDTRLAALRQTSIADLGAQSGIQVTRARGIWAREDALDKVHKRSEASRRSDWYVQVMLMVIELIGLIVTRNANADVVSYYSLRAHAEANDGTPENKRALELYRSVLARDPSVAEFRQDVFTAYRLLASYNHNFELKLYELAQAKTPERFRFTRHELEQAILKAWTETQMDVGMSMLGRYHTTAETVRFGLYLLGEIDPMDGATLPSLPRWPTYLGPDARLASSKLSLQRFIDCGWEDPTADKTEFDQWRERCFDAQQRLWDAIDGFHDTFGRTIAPAHIHSARTMYEGMLRGEQRTLSEAERFFALKGLIQPAWLQRGDPQPAVRAIRRAIETAAHASEPDHADHDDEDDRPAPEADGVRPIEYRASGSQGTPDRVSTHPGPRRHLHVVKTPTDSGPNQSA